MQIQELHGALYYALIAPDGGIQMLTLSPDFASCALCIKTMHNAGLIQSFHELTKVKGFQILPVKLTVESVKEVQPLEKQKSEQV